jgi:hypothetical protein
MNDVHRIIKRLFQSLVWIGIGFILAVTPLAARAQAPQCDLRYGVPLSFQALTINPISCAFEGNSGDRLEFITPQDLYDLYAPDGTLIEAGDDGIIVLPSSGVYRVDVVLNETAVGEGEAALETIRYEGNIELVLVTGGGAAAAAPDGDLSDSVNGVLSRVVATTYRRPRGLPLSDSTAGFCQDGFVTVLLRVDELYVRDPEEADLNSFSGSDESEIYFGIATGTPPANISFGNQSAQVVTGVYGQDARLGDIGFFLRELPCDQIGYVFIRAFERDTFLGTTYTILGAPLFIPLVSRLNLASGFNPRTEAVFAGSATDGDYDYRVFFTVEFYPGAVADTIVVPEARSSPFDTGVRQWATFAEATSQYGDDAWSANQVLGEPDTGRCGDLPTAWASATAGGQDALTVFFDTEVLPSQVNVYQTFGQGSIIRVDVIPANGGDPIPIPNSADPPGNTPCPGVFSVDTSMIEVPILGAIILVDQTIGGTWNEIDAVELVGRS